MTFFCVLLRRWSLFFACVWLALSVVGCDSGPPRAIIIGIDGASPRVVEPLMASGELPNLKKIADAGVYGPLKSFPPFLSPRVWTTIATGKDPLKHLIGSWVKPTETGSLELFYSYDRVGHALWNIASDAGLKVGVVNWLITYPPEIINGVMVSDHAFPGEIEGKVFVGLLFAESAKKKLEPVKGAEPGSTPVYPDSWAAKVYSPKHRAAKLTSVSNPFEEKGPWPAEMDLQEMARFYDLDQRLASISLEIEDELGPGVMMVLLQGIDRVSHFFWGCYEDPATYPPEFHPTAEERENCRRALLNFYRFSDALIGRLIEDYRSTDLVMVVSDHGFEAGFRPPNITGDHSSEKAEHGVFFARGANIPKGQAAGKITVNDITPTVLAWLGIPFARDMDGRPAAFLKVPLPPPVATYSTKPIERMKAGPSGGEQRMIDQLRSLGYVQ